ncbi:Uncharacterized protein Adt_31398 [Abeliophyllum distichum]|uniref:Uncharacterized protein n=1 Tax=Abeliophyllum distichum TaxID=126358 RepID=A0ABD1RE06_9LAMI
MCCIQNRHVKLEDYVDECYSKEIFLKAYNLVIHPMEGLNFGKERVRLPPHQKQPGMPKKLRKREQDEAPKSNNKRGKHVLDMTYNICRDIGYNKHSYKAKSANTSQELGKMRVNEEEEEEEDTSKVKKRN